MIDNLDRLCIHSITTKPWDLSHAVEHFAANGVRGISVWQDAAEAKGIAESKRILDASGMDVVSYVRGGFFAHPNDLKRYKAIDHNKKMIDEAAALGAPLLVLVCGSHPEQSLQESRDQIRASIETLLPYATSNGVKLGIEPLHPVYADTRSAIVNLAQANTIAEQIAHSMVGVVIDVYHLWWDDQLEHEIKRCGNHENIFAFHTCDWAVPTTDILNDREIMGQGCIQAKQIREWVDDAGFNGYIEVEIFSNKYWAQNQDDYLSQIINAYKTYA